MTDVPSDEGPIPGPDPEVPPPEAAPTPFVAPLTASTDGDQRPVFLLAFANDRYGPTTGYLRDLVAEMRAIEKALARSPIRVVARSNVTRDDLYDTLARHNDRIVGFHYGGHATESVLMLEDDEGRPAAARIEGLASRLAMLPRLSLVVLNGCSTADQVDVLRARCAAPIIATDQAIVDALARDFAQRFYADLAADRSIGEAFESAVSAIEASVESAEATHRSPDPQQTRMLRPAEHVSEGGWPWRLYADPQRLGWRISATITPARNPWPLRIGLAGVLVAAIFAFGWGLGGADDPCDATAERCNGRDDDCDGLTDETRSGAICGPLGLGRVWGEGRCVASACEMAACPAGWHDVDRRYATGCEYRCTPTGDEVCNAADDDCDGITDEGFAGCDPGCDGIDDDGDGRSDEGCAVVRCGPERADAVAVPPCNGCPDGIAVPSGWVCIPPGSDQLPPTWTHADYAKRARRSLTRWPPKGEREPMRLKRPLLMTRTEVTQAQWMARAASHDADAQPSRNPCSGGERRCPVDGISWFRAAAHANAVSRAGGLTPCYDEAALSRCVALEHCHRPGLCPRLGAEIEWCETRGIDQLRRAAGACDGVRLPTHAEWRYARRAGRDTLHVGGDGRTALQDSAWYGGKATTWPQPVGQLRPNAWGLYDMQGNAAEWLHDAPTGVRGCSARTPGKLCSNAYLESMRALQRDYTVGFRLVRPLPMAR